MHRIDDLIADPMYYYDDRAVDGWVEFCEKELTLTDGSDLHMLDSFKLWGEQVFGWYYFETRSVYVPNRDDRHWADFDQGAGDEVLDALLRRGQLNSIHEIAGRVLDRSFRQELEDRAASTIKMELMNILQGVGRPMPQVSIFWYKLDSVEEVALPP